MLREFVARRPAARRREAEGRRSRGRRAPSISACPPSATVNRRLARRALPDRDRLRPSVASDLRRARSRPSAPSPSATRALRRRGSSSPSTTGRSPSSRPCAPRCSPPASPAASGTSSRSSSSSASRALLGRRARRDQEAGQVPVRRAHPARQPLLGELVPGPRADEVELERLDQPLADLERVVGASPSAVRRHQNSPFGLASAVRASRRLAARLFAAAAPERAPRAARSRSARAAGPAPRRGRRRASGSATASSCRPDSSSSILVVEQELAVGRDVSPAVGVEDGPVHRGVQLAELCDVRVALVGVVEAVVGLGQALVVVGP